MGVGHTRIYAWGVVRKSACCKRCSRTRHETVRPKLTLLVEARFSPRILVPHSRGVSTPTIKLQFTHVHQENFARSDVFLKLGKCWSFNFPAFPSSIAHPTPIRHPRREQNGGIGNLGRSSANCSILDLPSSAPDRADEETESPELHQLSPLGR